MLTMILMLVLPMLMVLLMTEMGGVGTTTPRLVLTLVVDKVIHMLGNAQAQSL